MRLETASLTIRQAFEASLERELWLFERIGRVLRAFWQKEGDCSGVLDCEDAGLYAMTPQGPKPSFATAVVTRAPLYRFVASHN
jgi:hypothetical protein